MNDRILTAALGLVLRDQPLSEATSQFHVRKAYLSYRGTGPGPMPPYKQWVWSQALRLAPTPDALSEALGWVDQARWEIGLSEEDLD